jgi:hypothetical protein
MIESRIQGISTANQGFASNTVIIEFLKAVTKTVAESEMQKAMPSESGTVEARL